MSDKNVINKKPLVTKENVNWVMDTIFTAIIYILEWVLERLRRIV